VRRLVPVVTAVLVALVALPAPPAATAAPGQVCESGAAAPATVASTPGSEPGLVAVYPNPVARDDRGEFVVARFPGETDLAGWALADDGTRIPLPNRTVRGRVAFSPQPAIARNLTDAPVYRVANGLRLANAGDRVGLVDGDRTVATLEYESASEAEIYDGTWRPLGATDRPVVRGCRGTARLFVLPDAPGPPVAPLWNASDRILLAGYTFTSERAARALVAAADRGVRVRVLVEGSPVGGMSRRQARLLDRLVAADVQVRVVAGPYARYAFHHPKYAVGDDRAVVLTENWKPSGTGGHSSRGWGAAVHDPDVADGLAATFRADAGWRDAVPWREFRAGRRFEADEAADGSYPGRFAVERVRYRNASVLVAPDNAERAVLDRLGGADESIRVVQMGLGAESSFARALVEAGRRGVEVRVLLSGAWYAREENRRVARRLNGVADREDLPLEVRLAEPRGRYEKVHAKGVIIDGETVVLGSLNWNDHAATENREVLLALEGEEAADYFGRVFEADWRGSAWRLPLGPVAVVVLAVASCLLAARRFEFE